MMCPAVLLPRSDAEASVWQQVYQMAYEQARAAARPSWLERDILGVWN